MQGELDGPVCKNLKIANERDQIMAKTIARKGRTLKNLDGGLVEVTHEATRKGATVEVKTVVYAETSEGNQALIKAVTANPVPFREDINRTLLTDAKNGTVSSADPQKAAMKALFQAAATNNKAKAEINKLLKSIGQPELD